MTRTCKICAHEQRDEIERDILSRVSYRELASRYVSISKDSAHRHATNCIPELLAKARDAEDIARADVLVSDISRIRAAAFRALDRAEEAGDELTFLRAIREIRENVRLLGEVRGELNAAMSQKALISPVALNIIVGVLEPHPELAEAVADALEPLEALEEGSNGSGS